MKHLIPTALKDCQNIGLVGLGKSNRGVLSYLEECKEKLHFFVRAEKPFEDCRYPSKFNEGYLSDVFEDALILSPSVRPDIPEITEAKKKGVRILSDAEIFFRDTDAMIFAVSGSDGKSTTAALTAHLLSASVKKTVPAVGNIGVALTSLLSQAHPMLVCELSSFQLFHYAPRTKRAAITNLTQNHLNWHKGLDEYKWAKARLYENTEEPIVSLDENGASELLKRNAFAVYSVKENEQSMSKRKAEFAYYIKNDAIYENGRKLLPLSLFPLPGKHNLQNLLCALALCAGYTDEEAAREVSSFSMLSHRAQLIKRIRGVSYYDSSIDSSPSRTRATLDIFSSPVLLLLGGMGKNCDISPLLSPVKEKCRGVFCFGPFGKEARDFLLSNGYKGYLPAPFEKMADAFSSAHDFSENKDTVLLSPGATSFDEFKDFSERGERFRSLVLSIRT